MYSDDNIPAATYIGARHGLFFNKVPFQGGPSSAGSSVRSRSEGKILKDVHETRLVIAVDYGTTYTGVAYATPTGTHCNLDDIDVKHDWGATMDAKVPSVISYSRPELEWGELLSDDAVSMVHTKLELGPQTLQGELDMTLQVLDGMKNLNFDEMLRSRASNGSPAYSYKTPEEIVTDYLSKVFQYVEQEVQVFGPAARKLTATSLVFTVPSDWPYAAKNATYRALTQAGFNSENFPRLENVRFITEAEAAAVYTARYYRDEEGLDVLQQGDYFILCDAGGGTVDVVSYLVAELHPGLRLTEVCEPAGDKCGSIFINLEFKKWLRTLLGDDHYKRLDPNLDIEKSASHASETPAMRALMSEFDTRKRNFTGNGSGEARIDLPPPLQNLNIPGVNQGLITITRLVYDGYISTANDISTVMEKFFDACVARVASLIKNQIRSIAIVRNGRPKNLFLVGGFGESEYLQDQLAEMLKRERLTMRFRRPKESWTAVVRGAVICGIEQTGNSGLKDTSCCRYSYAICLDEIYAAHLHGEQEMIQINGNTVAQSQLLWVLNKGDLVLADTPYEVEKRFELRVPRSKPLDLSLPIYRYLRLEEDRPTHYSNAKNGVFRSYIIETVANIYKELEQACSLPIDLSKIQLESARSSILSGVTSYRASLKLKMSLSGTSLKASLLWNNKTISSGVVNY